MTPSPIIASISRGTPGSEMIVVPFHDNQNPGAEPTGFGSTVAPVGISACLNCPLFGILPH